MISSLGGALTLPLALYLPGWLIALAFRGQHQPADPLARHYERVVASALISGWLALLLAELGCFSLGLFVALLLLGALPLVLVARRRGLRFPQLPLGFVAGPANSGTTPLAPAALVARLRASAFTLASLAVLLVGALLVIRPFEVVLGGRDAGVYAVTGFAIAQHGSIVQHDALLASLAQARAAGDQDAAQTYSNVFNGQDPERFIATRLRAAGFFVNEGEAEQGRVVPQFLHLYPVWIALVSAALSLHGGLLATGLLATLGLWSVMMLGRALAGPAVGLLAGLLLCLNGVQVWFGRYSTSEACSQFLAFAALYAFAQWQALPDSDRDPAARFYAALTAVAAGQLALTRIDFFLIVGPLLLYLVYCALSRRWSRAHSVASLALAAMLVHAALHIALIARAYFFDTAIARIQDYAITSYLALPFQTEVLKTIYYGTTRSKLKDPRYLVQELVELAVLGLVAWLIYRFPQPLHLVETLARRLRRPLLGLAACALVLLAAYGYLVRPQILNADVLLNTRGGWGDPLRRDPELLRDEVQRGITGLPQAASDYGVVFGPVHADHAATQGLRSQMQGQLGKIEGKRDPDEVAKAVTSGEVAPPDAAGVYGVVVSALSVDPSATAALRARLLERRGPWHGMFSNDTPNWLRLQGYIGAPVNIPPGSDPRYTIALANMVRVGWYLSPLGVVLAVAGFALWILRGCDRRSWFFLAVALLASFFYIRQSYGTADQTYIYILRRFMPVVYPAACLASAYALVQLAGPGALPAHPTLRQLRLAAATALTGLLTLFLLVTNQALFRHIEYAGAIDQLADLATRFEPNAVVLLRGGGTGYIELRDVPEMVMTPLRFAFGVDALVVKSEQPGKYATNLLGQIRHWQNQGRPVYLALSSNGGSLSLPAAALEPVGSWALQLAEFEQLSTQKPSNVGSLLLPFKLYRIAPPGSPAPVQSAQAGPQDFAAQLRGFYRPEPAAPFVWANDDAVLRLARPTTPNAALHLRLAAGQRPQSLGPAQVCVAVAAETQPWRGGVQARPDDPPFTSLGCLPLAAAPVDQTLALPANLPPSANLLVRLQTRPWIPAQADPALRDQRLLGFQLHSVALR